ncbi:MAG: hypothetical protein ACPGVO_01570 [Spirulinaceae cyanobacterium]
MPSSGFHIIQTAAQTDQQGRISLGVDIKNKTFRVSQNEQGQILLEPIEAKTDTDPTAQTQAEILADFRQGWHEAMTSQTIPIAQLWDGIDDA